MMKQAEKRPRPDLIVINDKLERKKAHINTEKKVTRLERMMKIIVAIGSDKQLMQAIRNQADKCTYTAADENEHTGLILFSGTLYRMDNATLALEPVNDSVNLVLRMKSYPSEKWQLVQGEFIPFMQDFPTLESRLIDSQLTGTKPVQTLLARMRFLNRIKMYLKLQLKKN